jgi:hypothetical protein
MIKSKTTNSLASFKLPFCHADEGSIFSNEPVLITEDASFVSMIKII